MGSRPIEEKVTKKQLDAFFTHLNLTGNVKASCVKANMLRRHIYRLRERDLEIATRWQEALDSARDEIDAEVTRRGKDGWLEPLIVSGKVAYYPANQPRDENGNEIAGTVMMIRRFSDKLLETLHKGLHPDRYNPNNNVAAARPVDLLPDPPPTPDEPGPANPRL